MNKRPSRKTFELSPTASTWGVAEPGRTIAVVFCVALGWFLTYVYWTDDTIPSAIALLIVTPVGGWAAAIRPWLGVDEATIVIVNPLSTKVIALADATGAENGYDGLRVKLVDGSSARAWAVQKSNLMEWIKRPTRSDRVVEQLNVAIRRQEDS